MTFKREYPTKDAAPAVLYAKKEADKEQAYPVLQSMLNPGFSLPQFDTVEVDSNTRPTSVVYQLSGETVATLTITYPSGGIKIVRS